jgi:hypothetical protein
VKQPLLSQAFLQEEQNRHPWEPGPPGVVLLTVCHRSDPLRHQKEAYFWTDAIQELVQSLLQKQAVPRVGKEMHGHSQRLLCLIHGGIA